MFRFVRASLMFGRIFLSYGWLALMRKLLGQERTEAAFRRAHTRNARRLYRGFVRLRGVFIKLGQVMSILGSFLPPEFIRELEGLQDQVVPQAYRRIRATFRTELGRGPEAIFDEFEATPIAAASLGQVHRAVLPGGRTVAVKVLYANIGRIIAIDLRVLGWVFKVYRRLVPVQQLENIFNQLRDVLSRETDYQAEAENLKRLRHNFEAEPDIRFPDVVEELSGPRILVMEFMDGIKITAVSALEAAHISPHEVAKRLVQSYYKQFLLDGLYHADPHPGNFLVQPGPVIVFLDFGAVEPVRPTLKRGMLQFLEGLLSRDDERILNGIETMGFVAPDGNRDLLEQTVRYYFKKLVTMQVADYSRLEVGQIVSRQEIRSARGKLRELMRSVQYPEGFFFIERSLLLLFGLCATLDPTVNALELGFPYAVQFILKSQQSPRRAADSELVTPERPSDA